MNRIAVAVVLLALLAAFSAFGQIAMHTVTDEFSDGLQQLRAYVQTQDYAAAARLGEELLCRCNRREPLLTLFIRHDLINALRVNLSGLAAYSSSAYRQDLLLEVERAQAQVEAIRRQYFDLA